MKRRMLGSAVLGAALLVAGCGAGQITQTDTQQAGVNGAKAQVGDIAIRDATLTFPDNAGSGPAVYPPGSDVDLRMSIVNEGAAADELVSARSDAATSVAIEGTRTVYGGNTLRIGAVPPDLEGVEDGKLILRDLTTQVRPGELVSVTLTFRDAGRVTLEMPVAGPDEPLPSRVHEGGESGESGGDGH